MAIFFRRTSPIWTMTAGLMLVSLGGIVGQNCTLCPNGNAPPDPDKKLNVFSNAIWRDSETCGDLAADPNFRNQGDALCKANQITFGVAQCGCEQDIQIGVDCSLCPGGTSNFNTDAPLNANTVDEFGKSTCGELATEPLFQDQGLFDCVESQLTIGLAQCGCDTGVPVGGCSLCPDGSMEYDPDVVVDPTTGTTCGNLASLATLSPIDQCDFFHFTGARKCGCPKLEDDKGCSLCADKSQPSNLDNFLDNLFGGGDDENTKCGDALVDLPFVPVESDLCTAAQWAAAVACECPAPDDGCSLCFDESIPNKIVDGIFDFFLGGEDEPMMCSEAATIAKLFPQDSSICRQVQVAGAVACDCPPPEDGCTICYDGLLPGYLDGIFEFIGGGDGRNCRDIYELTPLIPKDSPICTYVQGLAFIDCKCPILPDLPKDSSPLTAPCEICDDESMKADLSKIIEGTNLTCGDLFNASSFFLDSKDCRDEFTDACCITADPVASPTKAPVDDSSAAPTIKGEPTTPPDESSSEPTPSSSDASPTPSPSMSESSSEPSSGDIPGGDVSTTTPTAPPLSTPPSTTPPSSTGNRATLRFKLAVFSCLIAWFVAV